MRLRVKDLVTGKLVNITLRIKSLVDLTSYELNESAYTHLENRTVSGRLQRQKNNYVFVR